MVTQTLIPTDHRIDELLDELDQELDSLPDLVEEWPTLPRIEQQSILIEFDDLLFATLDLIGGQSLAPDQRSQGERLLLRVRDSLPLLGQLAPDVYPNALAPYLRGTTAGA